MDGESETPNVSPLLFHDLSFIVIVYILAYCNDVGTGPSMNII